MIRAMAVVSLLVLLVLVLYVPSAHPPDGVAPTVPDTDSRLV